MVNLNNKSAPECPLCGKQFIITLKMFKGVAQDIYTCMHCKIEIHKDDPFVGKWVTNVKFVAEDTKGYSDLLETPICPMCKAEMNTFARIDEYFKMQCTVFFCRAQIESTGLFPFEEYMAQIINLKAKKITDLTIAQTMENF